MNVVFVLTHKQVFLVFVCEMMIQQAAAFMDPVQQEIFVVFSACVSF